MRYLPIKLNNGDVLVVIESSLMSIPALSFHGMADFKAWLWQCFEWCSCEKNYGLFPERKRPINKTEVPDTFKKAFNNDGSVA